MSHVLLNNHHLQTTSTVQNPKIVTVNAVFSTHQHLNVVRVRSRYESIISPYRVTSCQYHHIVSPAANITISCHQLHPRLICPHTCGHARAQAAACITNLGITKKPAEQSKSQEVRAKENLIGFHIAFALHSDCPKAGLCCLADARVFCQPYRNAGVNQ